MNKKICISGYYGFENFGDETILDILIKNLKQFKSEPEITVFSVNPIKTKEKYKVNSVQTFNLFKVLTEIIKCDCLISGGGSLLQDSTSKKSLIYYLAVIFFAVLFCKKVIIFAQGIGPISDNFLRNITKVLLKFADLVTVRDKNSYELINQWGIKSVLINDPVWNIPVSNTPKTDKIGVQLRDFHSVSADFINKLADCINKFYFDKNIIILSLQNSLDLKICNQLKNKLKNKNPGIKVEVIQNNSNEEVIKNIALLEALIAMRYHACLIAIKNNVKLLPINYDIKVECLSKEFNLESLSIKDYANMSEIFENFKQKQTEYDKEVIEKLNFDFSLIEKVIQ